MQLQYVSIGQIFGGPGRLTIPLLQRPYLPVPNRSGGKALEVT